MKKINKKTDTVADSFQWQEKSNSLQQRSCASFSREETHRGSSVDNCRGRYAIVATWILECIIWLWNGGWAGGLAEITPSNLLYATVHRGRSSQQVWVGSQGRQLKFLFTGGRFLGCSTCQEAANHSTRRFAAARQHLALKRSPIKKGCWERMSKKKKVWGNVRRVVGRCRDIEAAGGKGGVLYEGALS